MMPRAAGRPLGRICSRRIRQMPAMAEPACSFGEKPAGNWACTTAGSTRKLTRMRRRMIPSMTGSFMQRPCVSCVERQEVLTIVGFAAGKVFAQAIHGQRAMLETPLRKDRHVEASDGLHSARNDFAFERVELFHVHACEFGEGDSFGDFDDVRARERAEAFQAKMFRRSVRARVTAGEAP